jgi:asparagine synthase (glutamine-hydrolysing)
MCPGVKALCGIVGLVTTENSTRAREDIVWRMVRSLVHRGPDEQSVVSSGPATFGVARLSIVDRAAAQQPMSLDYEGRNALIAYNGEVYNFKNLLSEFQSQGVPIRTHSDTEAVLAAHLVSGSAAVRRLDGMFAYGLWQQPANELVLVRDRLGIKPLFYVDFGDALLFASEPKALFCYPRLQCEPNFSAILEYFLHGAAFASGYTTGDRAFFQNVKALPPGHVLTWTPERGIRLARYWSPLDEMHSLRMDKSRAQEEIADTMTASVQSMLMGEVPIGTALSGGIDSSLITVETSRAMSDRLVSACITYRANADDPDASHATLLSTRLNEERPGSHLLEYTHLHEGTYLDSIDDLVLAFDEPHWEPRQLAMFENYRTLARLGRTVVLTGEGADELFFGYYQKFPGFRTPLLKHPGEFANLWRERLPRVTSLLSPAFASGLMSTDLADHLIESAVASYLTPCWEATGDRLRGVQAWYLHTFLPWLLMDNDRCSMAHGIEGRFPFLSQRMVSLALQLPPEWNLPDDGSLREKVLLRRAVADRLPVEIWRDRDKSPLPIPNAVAYAEVILRRLELEIESANAGVWEILDRARLLAMINEFKSLMQVSGADSGEFLTSYIALGAMPRVRTAELFAVLTLLRWYDLFFFNPGRDSSCYRLRHQETAPTGKLQFQTTG